MSGNRYHKQNQKTYDKCWKKRFVGCITKNQ